LGNVRVTFKEGINPGTVELIDLKDYYPFGSPMPGKSIVPSNEYQFSYQGQGLDKETGFVNFALRQYDPRLGKWLSPDPYFQHHSPYLAMSNNPVSFIDPDGGEDATCQDCGEWSEEQRKELLTEIARYNWYLQSGRARAAKGVFEHLFGLEAQFTGLPIAEIIEDGQIFDFDTDEDGNIIYTKDTFAVMNQMQVHFEGGFYSIIGRRYNPSPMMDDPYNMYDKISNGSHIGAFFNGLANAHMSNTFGEWLFPRKDPAPNEFASTYYAGRVAGDVISLAVGIIETTVGAILTAGGGTISLSGVGAVIGVPAAAVGVPLTIHGGFTVWNAAGHLIEDIDRRADYFGKGNKSRRNSGGGGNYKKINSNKAADDYAREIGYDNAEDLKLHHVDDPAKFNIYRDSKTNDGILQKISDSSVQVPIIRLDQ